jgi:hypothetical protein
MIEQKTLEEIVAEQMRRYDKKYFNKPKNDDQTKTPDPEQI